MKDVRGFIGRISQKWNIIFGSMFSLVYNLSLYLQRVLVLFPGDCHASTVAQDGQMKHWLWIVPNPHFAAIIGSLASLEGEGRRRCQLITR